jgi:hypothetical protein
LQSYAYALHRHMHTLKTHTRYMQLLTCAYVHTTTHVWLPLCNHNVYTIAHLRIQTYIILYYAIDHMIGQLYLHILTHIYCIQHVYNSPIY